MKTAGKTALFLVTLLLLLSVIFLICTAVLMTAGGFYTSDRSDLMQSVADVCMERFWMQKARQLRRPEAGEIQTFPDAESSFRFAVFAEDGTPVAYSAHYDPNQKAVPVRFYVSWWEEMPESVIPASWGFPKAPDESEFVLQGYFSADSGAWDLYRIADAGASLLWKLRFWIYLILLAAALLFVLCYIWLLSVSGRRPCSAELHPGPLHAVPFDVLLALTFVLCALPIGLTANVPYLWIPVAAILISLSFLGLSMSFAARIKLHTLLHNTLLAIVLRGIGRGFRFLHGLCSGVPHLLRTVLIVGAVCLAEFFWILASDGDTGAILLFWLPERVLLVPLLFACTANFAKLCKAGRELAAGKLDFKTDVSQLFGQYRRHGEDLNHIGDGMTKAVEERTRSERMKTELITNVSHDLKTPLTSIVNYSALIGKEPCENEKITEYASVLLRQSERLKRLIEDLVEASKASTGNLEVHPERCDAGVFLSQAAGEYEEKLTSAGLTLMVRQPEEPIMILADGRRMWRVFDNLMNNICKYSQSGTRVYLTLETRGRAAVITFRNTSREPLDVPPEELTERFVRGDRSRNTEGSGLGLSIAKSLTELQGGWFEITVDGDLFKTELRFPLLETEAVGT